MKEEITCEFKDIENDDFVINRFLKDWQDRIDNSSNKPEDFKLKLDVSEIRKNWVNYPVGIVRLPFVFEDGDEENTYRLEIPKRSEDEECPFKEDIMEFTLDTSSVNFSPKDDIINVDFDYSVKV